MSYQTEPPYLVIIHLQLEQVTEEELDVRPVRVDNDVINLLALDLPQHLPKLIFVLKLILLLDVDL